MTQGIVYSFPLNSCLVHTSHPNFPPKEIVDGVNMSHSFITMLSLHPFYMP